MKNGKGENLGVDEGKYIKTTELECCQLYVARYRVK